MGVNRHDAQTVEQFEGDRKLLQIRAWTRMQDRIRYDLLRQRQYLAECENLCREQRKR